MAGQPKKAKMIMDLEERTRATFDNETATHLDYLEFYQENGGTLVRLAREMNAEWGFEGRDKIEPAAISRYLDEKFGSHARARMAEARIIGASRLAEESVDLVDAAGANKDEQLKARNQAAGRQWIAERWNRNEYGQPKQAAVVVNIGTLHLDALRKRASEGAVSAPVPRAFISPDTQPARYPDAPDVIDAAIVEHVQILSDDDSTS